MSDLEIEEGGDDILNDSKCNVTVDYDYDDYEPGNEVECNDDNEVYSTDMRPICSVERQPARSVMAPTMPPISEESTIVGGSPVEMSVSKQQVDSVPSERSAFGEASGLMSSFGVGPAGSNFSGEFQSGAAALSMLKHDEEDFDRSGRRLQIPDNFDPDKVEKVASWEPDLWRHENDQNPFDQQPKSSFERNRQELTRDDRENFCWNERKQSEKEVENVVKETPSEPIANGATPVKEESKCDILTTPVRPRGKVPIRKEAATAGFSSSTPKVQRGAPSKVDFGDISAINTTTNTTMDSTAGGKLSLSAVDGVVKGMGPTASVTDILSALENLRNNGQKKEVMRDLERSALLSKSTTARPPLKERQRHGLTTTRKDKTMVDSTRVPNHPKEPTMSASASSSRFSTASNSRTSCAASRMTNSETMSSDAYSRPASAAMSDAGSLPDRRLSSATTACSIGDGLKVDRKYLCFGCVDEDSTIVSHFLLTNGSQQTVRVELKLRKPTSEGSAFEILDGMTKELRAGEELKIRVQWKPRDTGMTHSNTVKICNLKTGEVFGVHLRGSSGTPKIKIDQIREKHSINRHGVHFLKWSGEDDSVFMKVVSAGSRRVFCKVVVIGDGQMIPCEVRPHPAFVLKAGVSQEVEVKVRNIERFLTSNVRASTHSLVSSSSDTLRDMRLQIILFWGDEHQRLRVREFLRKSSEKPKDEFVTTLTEKFMGEKKFVEMENYPVMRNDLKLFEVGLSKTEILVTSLAVNGISNFEDINTTLGSEMTFCDRSDFHEKTLVPDENATMIVKRR